jgi:beta-glucosidase
MNGIPATNRNRHALRKPWMLPGLLLLSVLMLSAGCGVAADAPATGAADGKPLWLNPDKPVEERVKDLMSRMTPAERAGQICENAVAIPRIGVPAYNYWNECLHGVARAGVATVFPQAIGMAATWDTPLVHQEADVIATEARAKHREYTASHNGNSAQFFGLNFWTPNINIFRDPRWGRGQETYGEDPFLTGRLAVAFITGLQGDDPHYYKALACAKHFAVHSGPESLRHKFDAVPSERDLYETYLPQFEAAVREGHVGAVMGAYNSVDGVPACASPFLLTEILRQRWGFEGHVVSDCGAINDIFDNHGYAKSYPEAAGMSLKAGCDLGCWGSGDNIMQALKNGFTSEADIDRALERVLTARFRLGLFDPPERVPYAQIPVSANDTPEHAQLALRVARESIVVLKNDGVLPLDRTHIKRIAVMGLNATGESGAWVLVGNYNGSPSHMVPILDGIKAVAGPNVEVVYEPACSLVVPYGDTSGESRSEAMTRAVEEAKKADAVIYVGGLSPLLENEERGVPYDGFDNGDRTRIELPAVQTQALKALRDAGKPVIYVNCSGSAVAMPWEAENLAAIVQAWYPGQEGGTAVAEVLFGDVNPGGRLPVTFYRGTDDLPSFTDYSMTNRTYRYFNGKPLFAFGHGLSYTSFDYKSVKCDRAEAGPADTVHVSLDVANTGARDGDEVVQVYFRHVDSAVPQPREALCGFRRVTVAHGKSAGVEIEVPLERFRYWDVTKQKYIVEPGKYELLVGAASDDIRTRIPFSVVPSK